MDKRGFNSRKQNPVLSEEKIFEQTQKRDFFNSQNPLKEFFISLDDSSLIDLVNLDILKPNKDWFVSFEQAINHLPSDSKTQNLVFQAIKYECEEEVSLIIGLMPKYPYLFKEFKFMKDKDEMRKKFSDESGDLGYLLNLFKMYLASKSQKNLRNFETQYNISLRDFERAEENATEILKLINHLKQLFGKSLIISKYPGNTTTQDFKTLHNKLLYCIYKAYGESLYTFSGDSSCLYHPLSRKLTSQKLHSGSILALNKQNPKYIIIIEVKLPKFSINLFTAVHTSWLDDKKVIEPEIVSTEKRMSSSQIDLKDKLAHKINNLPTSIIARFLKSKPYLGADVFIDMNVEDSSVIISTTRKNIQEVISAVEIEIKKLENEFKHELSDVNFCGRSVAVLGHGCKISDILVDNEFRTITVQITDIKGKKEVIDIIKNMKNASVIDKPDSSEIIFSFESTEDCQKALRILNDKKFSIQSICPVYPSCRSYKNYGIDFVVSWTNGVSTDTAFYILKNGTQIKLANPLLQDEFTLRKKISNAQNAFNIKEIVVLRKKGDIEFRKFEEEKKIIIALLEKMNLKDSILEVEFSENSDSLIRKAIFKVNSLPAIEEIKEIFKEKAKNQNARFLTPCTKKYSISKKAMKILYPEINRARTNIYNYFISRNQIVGIEFESFSQNHKIFANEVSDITIECEQREALNYACRMIEQVINPRVIQVSKAELRKIMANEGLDLIKKFSIEGNVFTLCSKEECCIKIWGTLSGIEYAHKHIRAMIKSLTIEEYNFDYSKKVVNQLLLRHKKGLYRLKQKYGNIVFETDELSKIIKVSGQKSELDELIKELETLFDKKTEDKSELKAEEECGLCLDNMKTRFVLMNCNHSFCLSCISDYIADSANNPLNVPVKCPACLELICLQDIRTLTDEKSLKKILDNSIKKFLRESEFKNCPTNDCIQIFRSNRNIFSCETCLESYCCSCFGSFHPKQTCEEAKKDREELSPEARALLGIKSCPDCHKDIQKGPGCMHMTCPCGCHFCWVCLAGFKTAGECYSHLSSKHQNIY